MNENESLYSGAMLDQFFGKTVQRNLWPIQSEEEADEHWEDFKESRKPIENKK